MPYVTPFLPDGRREYNPSRTQRDIHEEWATLEAEVRAEDPTCRFPDMVARERWRKREAEGETWSQWQQRVWFPRMRAAVLANPQDNVTFTLEELERLTEHFGGSNDPVTQSIFAKCWAALIRIELKAKSASPEGE